MEVWRGLRLNVEIFLLIPSLLRSAPIPDTLNPSPRHFTPHKNTHNRTQLSGPSGRSGCCLGTKKIWNDSEIEVIIISTSNPLPPSHPLAHTLDPPSRSPPPQYLYVRENSVEIFSPIHNKRCCGSPFTSAAEVLYFDSAWKVRPAGSVSPLRGFFCGDNGEKVVFEFCPWWCCCERKREVGVLDGAATVRVIERVRGLAARRLSMERK